MLFLELKSGKTELNSLDFQFESHQNLKSFLSVHEILEVEIINYERIYGSLVKFKAVKPPQQ